MCYTPLITQLSLCCHVMVATSVLEVGWYGTIWHITILLAFLEAYHHVSFLRNCILLCRNGISVIDIILVMVSIYHRIVNSLVFSFKFLISFSFCKVFLLNSYEFSIARKGGKMGEKKSHACTFFHFEPE